MAKQDTEDFNLDDIPGDDTSVLFGDETEDEVNDPDEEPEEKPSVNSKSKKGKKQTDESEESESEENEDEDQENEEEDFSDLGFDKDGKEADDKKTSKKIPAKFKGKSLEDVVEAYENSEKEIGRLRNEVNDLKKNPPKKEDKPDEGNSESEKVDLLKIFDVSKLNDQLLTSDRPGEVLLVTIASAFNELQKQAVKSVTKIMDDRHKEYQSNYFDEIDQNRAAKEAAKPFVAKVEKLSKKYKDWGTVLPWMQKAIANKPDLVKEPDDYEPLYERCKAYLKANDMLEDLTKNETSRKRSGGLSNSRSGNRGEMGTMDERDTISQLLGDE